VSAARVKYQSAVIAGAGLSGATAARILAEAGLDVQVFEKRPYVGGNCADCYDAHAILVHRHGPHAFHTGDKAVWAFVNRFAKWSNYRHKVMAVLGDKVLPVPVNLITIESAYANPHMIFHAAHGRYTVRQLMLHDDPEMRKLGHWVWQNFYVGYSAKQWGIDPKDLPEWIIDRVPVNFNREPYYHIDKWQGLPIGGYTAMVERMLDHPKIVLKLNEPVTLDSTHLIYTGSLDELFLYQHGALPYRSLKFEYEHHRTGPVQKCAQYNYPDVTTKFTRVVEYRHMTDEAGWRGPTTICREFPSDKGEPYYPVAGEIAAQLHQQYSGMAEKSGVWCLGRLARYEYVNMNQAVKRAMEMAGKFLEAAK
jgi:UDP-galactopyranose mutase